MAAILELTDSFDHWDKTRPHTKWDHVNIINDVIIGSSSGLDGNGALINSGNYDSKSVFNVDATGGNGSGMLEKVFATHATQWTIGMAFRYNDELSIQNIPLLEILDSNTLITYIGQYYASQCALLFTPQQQLVFMTGEYTGFPGNKISTYSPPLKRKIWYYLEASFTIGAAGSVTLRMDGKQVISATGVNTQATGTAYGDGVRILFPKQHDWAFAGGVREYHVDNVYVISGGSFLTDVKIEAALPIANGASQDWTSPGAGSVNYRMVNQNPPDDNATYDTATAAGNVDTYQFSPLVTAAGTVHGVGVNVDSSNFAADAPTISGVVRQGGVNYPTTLTGAPGTFASYNGKYFGNLTNPATSAKFTISEAGADEFGVKRET